MASKAIRTQHTIIAYSLVTPPVTYTPLGEVISFDGPGGKAAIIDITNLASVAKEKLPGLPDEGQFSMTCNFAGEDAGQQALADARTGQDLVNFKVTFTDASTAAFAAYVMEYKISGKADSKVELALTVEITGAVAWQYPTGLAEAEAGAGIGGASKAGASKAA
jgi:predicted secreted protein